MAMSTTDFAERIREIDRSVPAAKIPATSDGRDESIILKASNLNAWFGDLHAIRDINLEARTRTVTALIGPSGCGKSTFIRCLNRLHEEVPGARVEGQVVLDGEDIYAKGVDPVAIRRRIGMV